MRTANRRDHTGADHLGNLQGGVTNATGAGVHQARTLTEIESLLERLSEWENFQSILTLTRDILNRQKNLTERTRQFAKDN